MAVKGLDDLENLIPMLKGLGESHVKKGVLQKHYPIVGQALIMTLKTGHGKNWNQRTEDAWKAIY
jgi:hemoglobin-like flavoprotein